MNTIQRTAALLILATVLVFTGGLLLFQSPGQAGPPALSEAQPLPRLQEVSRTTSPLPPRPVRTPTSPFSVRPTMITPTATPFRAAANTRTAVPTATAVVRQLPPTLPASAEVKGMYGYGQLLPLSCEARAAADWARHFGLDIREMEFMARLPTSDDPEEGFVGSPYGSWGQIPPGAYGVHAGPVARVLKSYGASARAARNLRFYDLQAELAAGRPVIVWVVGHVEPGKGVPYEVSGKTILVARYEHTVILTGYSAQEVTILDGKTVYQRPIDTFLKSWSALGNMAVLWEKGAPDQGAGAPACAFGKGC